MELPKEHQTTLGLYVTSKEAYDLWKNAPENVKILDVRTFDEYIYVGHAPMAWNIPGFLQTTIWDEEKKYFTYKMNPDFVNQIKEVFQPDDTILVTCRSGARSALAANLMAKLGYTNVYNITDGFEGEVETNPESKDFGKRVLNGWKNANVPWTYDINLDLVKTPSE